MALPMPRRRAGGAAALLCLTALLAASGLAAAKKVVELSPQAFANMRDKSKKLLLVEFYSPDCYHCQAMDPVLEGVAEKLGNKVTVVKIDSRSAHDLNRELKVRGTPTMLMFKDGQEITEAREDIQGYRTVDVLSSFVARHMVPEVTDVSSVEEVDELVEEEGLVVMGLFNNATDKYTQTFGEVAKKWRRYMRFVRVADTAAATSFAEAYEVDEVPAVLIVKRRDVVLQYDGQLTKRADLEDFVNMYGFPLVGKWGVLTYYRYKNRSTPRVYLFHTANQAQAMESAMNALEEVAADFDEVSFMTVNHEASESDKIRIMHKVGLTDFSMPAIAAAPASGEGSLAMDQLQNITADSVRAFMNRFASEGWFDKKHRCDVIQSPNDREGNYTGVLLDNYRSYVEREKSRLGLVETEIREIDEYAFRKVAQKTWRDVLTIYTCRTCLHSLHLEDTLHKMVRRGDLADLLEEELMIVKVDVALTKTLPQNHIKELPAMKYTSARYRDFPNWFQGSPYEPEDIFQFIRAYHSMRHVEIPGEGPSPFSKKPDRKLAEDALDQELAARTDDLSDEEIEELEALARNVGIKRDEL
mmetsp:Transcript_2247/g.5599  ORF Transcript_2247/g.5599 Transcript_2247/m.5599 type:complete len:585 (+) Transcript_2247:240-1994(+)|eukprot:jgi/Tetstr1/427621/TSEL_017746.t1